VKDLDTDDSLMLKWGTQKQYTGMCSGFSWLKIGSVVGSCEESYEPKESSNGQGIHTLGMRLLFAE